ncbi:MAG: DUF1028 domain-containing protein [Armatimonadetes bacterium]|nr:DUF1028 domain-containing protein [Armatimonadota bacterium]MDW8122931.1 DUF1028 domain-containing protein [Armatimonadota bacterium]
MIGIVTLLLAGPFQWTERDQRIATFSIVAIDRKTGDLGVAVASRFLAVGAVVPFAKSKVGAIATQSYANTTYGPKGLSLLAKGWSATQVLSRLLKDDPERELRQVGIVDAKGRAAAFTGKKCLPWAGHIVGDGFAVQGNILSGPQVIQQMAQVFQKSTGSLAERLMAALEAGEDAGGDARGKQSAAILVVRQKGGYLGLNDRFIDLRVDDHPEPVKELKRILGLQMVWNFLREAAQLRQKKRLSQSVAIIKTALQKYPDAGVLHYDLACYLALMGRQKEAIVALEKAIHLDPSLRILAVKDDDLSSLRTLPDFDRIVSLAGKPHH